MSPLREGLGGWYALTMKFYSAKTFFLVGLPLAASFLLGSCVSDGGYGYGYQGGGGHRSVMYTSLPPNYSGQSYYYNKRYYAGGRYETGRYSHN